MPGATSVTSLESGDARGAAGVPKAAAISQGQCTPMPLPPLGTQRIIQGNGTNVGTVISLQCPDQHRLVGSNVVCVMNSNVTQWVGRTYCSPLSPSAEFGFRVAVLASIVSSAIILLLSLAFITCCLHERFNKKKRKRKKQRRETAEEEWLRDHQHGGGGAGYPHHHSRNYNNNNSRQKAAAPRLGGHDRAFVGDKAPCGSCLHPACHPTVPSSTLLPGKGYNPSPVTRDIRPNRDAAGPRQGSLHHQHASAAPHGPPCPMGCGAQKSGPAQSLGACSADGRGAGVVRQFGVQAHRTPLLTQHTSQGSYVVDSDNECSIRIVSV